MKSSNIPPGSIIYNGGDMIDKVVNSINYALSCSYGALHVAKGSWERVDLL